MVGEATQTHLPAPPTASGETPGPEKESDSSPQTTEKQEPSPEKPPEASQLSEPPMDHRPPEAASEREVVQPAPVEPISATAEPEKDASLEKKKSAEDSVSLAAMMDKEEPEVGEKEKPLVQDKAKIPLNLSSFKEESNKVSDLSDSERRALSELKELVQEALKTHQLSEADQEVSIWGVPLLKDERSDVILLKFLRARDFNVKHSFTMLKNTIKWRNEFKIDELVDEDLGDDLEKVVFMHGHDRDGHTVCYNVYGEFQNKELYQKTFSDAEKRMRFLRWRIQSLERSIRKLDFSPGGVSTLIHVNDLKGSPGPGKRDLRLATKQALQLLQDNYPEFVFKQVFINAPWWYLAFYTLISPFMTQRSKSKLVFAGPSRSPETLFKYISPEQVPIQYGGLSVDFCDCNPEFTVADPATEITVKPGTKQTVEIIIYEKCVIVWEIRVVGWEVSYNAEFVPDAKDGYTVIIQKPRKMAPTDEPVVCQSFKISNLGKVLLTVDNPTSKKKKLLYRYKVEPLCE